jgi:transposase InsO family protein
MVTPEGFILRDTRLVIPVCLQARVVDLAHETHLGITRIKKPIRSKVWFPGIDVMVEDKVKKCMGCQAAEPSGTSLAPLQMSTMPVAPWVELSIDFFGPIAPTNEYIAVLMDDYSRFPLVEILTSFTAMIVTQRLNNIFSIFGIPKKLRSDNGPPFSSREFADFCDRLGILHRLITPLWPRANAIDESFMKGIGKVVRTAKIDGVPWKERLVDHLRQYRSTPHSSTNAAPAELLFRNSDPSKILSYNTYFKPD